jgi:hypothetical protein
MRLIELGNDALMRHESPHRCFTVDPVGLRAPTPMRCHRRGRVDDVALNVFLFQYTVSPEPIQPRFRDHDDRKVPSHSPASPFLELQ